jgi:predicted transcriptional regulator
MTRPIILCLRVDETERDLLHKISRREGTSMSEITRRALRDYAKLRGVPVWEWLGLPESSEVRNAEQPK